MIFHKLTVCFRRLYRIVESVVMWLFRTEICLFLSVSGILSAFCVLESILHPDENSETLEVLALSNDTTSDPELDVSSSPIENISTFISLVLGLFAVLLALWKVAVKMFFGSLTSTERISLSKSLFRFVLFHFIILSGALNPSRLTSLFGWLCWFSVLGVLHMLTSVASSRCNQLSASGAINTRQWIRIYLMFAVISVANWYLLKAGLENCFILSDIDVATNGDFIDIHSRNSFLTGLKTPTVLGALKAKITGKKELLYDAVDVVALLVSEFTLLMCTVSHLVCGLIIQAYDRWCLRKGQSWLYHSTVTYYYELFFTCLYRLTEITHYLHLLLWSRVFSVASLVVFLHIRMSYSKLANSISRHLAQRRLMKYIRENYQACKMSECVYSKDAETKMETDDKTSQVLFFGIENESALICAICWDVMASWRRLPCRHDFHEHCLRAWLEQNPSCPTCRRDLGIPPMLLHNHNRTQRSENVALGMLVRNLFNNVGNEGPINRNGANNIQPPMTLHNTAQPNQISGISRMFATAVGLNLGLSIGAAPVVAAAAQAAALNALPRESATPQSSLASISNSQTEEASSTSTHNTDNLTAHEVTHINNQDNQQAAAGNEARDQIRRRSFHFDGSRYFSWLPSLHVELSEVFREVFHVGGIQSFGGDQPNTVVNDFNNRTSGRQATDVNNGVPNSVFSENNDLNALPLYLRVSVDQLTNMFPQFPRSVIIDELLATGVPDLAAENLMARPSPITSNSTSTNVTPTTSTTVYQNNLLTATVTTNGERGGTNLSSSSRPFVTEPLDTAVDENEELDGNRNSSFAARRRTMLSKARKRFMARFNNNSST
ncbi:E3 ubiquitin-protein ligase AMFR isoform 1 [Schistosoma japonicum]|uniref:E3 ubiquitin-protein ligase AMFR isoform 1 n=1 Tax=Schistosoma japonicum TaxID=6182 RepID=A0A4Z2CMN8_SCHJA|nr:E3 ubiquitin-protein ligase [Schistosoma japonicum]KAH8876224.1 E3 ubiquitin-protein ligase [Schistosoma japonicum]KAH8876225.1 E3 ubiquitin-protein ligase [Schistosoma japonicum]KAH8876226.1 E3 ubiquitin-protein ligase [Schistosoma japonicum]KAH8876230.1 E3 ubiquitin-protein ligase [Schistosoma japonicum]